LLEEGERKRAKIGNPEEYVDTKFTKEKACKGLEEIPKKWLRIKD